MVKGALTLKKEAFQAWLACGTPETADRYQWTKRNMALAVVEAKSQAWEDSGEAMGKDFWLASKRFWQTNW